MFFFNRHTTIADSGMLQGYTDWHSHLLPGVDDGAQTMDETLQILESYEWLGIRRVWLTPHIMEDMPNRTADLRERFRELRSVYRGSVILNLAAENMLDNLFEERLEKGDLLPLGKYGEYLLVETSYFNPPMGLTNIMLRIKAKGYTPVLAHPERYAYMNIEDYHRLKAMGVKFQMNLPSIAGMYGPPVKKKAEWMLKNNLCDMTGSDTHSLKIWETTIVRSVAKKSLNSVQCSVFSV